MVYVQNHVRRFGKVEVGSETRVLLFFFFFEFLWRFEIFLFFFFEIFRKNFLLFSSYLEGCPTEFPEFFRERFFFLFFFFWRISLTNSNDVCEFFLNFLSVEFRIILAIWNRIFSVKIWRSTSPQFRNLCLEKLIWIL